MYRKLKPSIPQNRLADFSSLGIKESGSNLQSVGINNGKYLAFNPAESGTNVAIYDAVLTGQGGTTLDFGAGAITFGNAANTYAGATSLTGETLLHQP